ncbi:FUSC family protein [Luteimonas sp. MJ246]|uniref:FUSC family protein n=1 Tax=Luteimonas sp. MJ174 TaxID=3129237 RepID=UPI0031BA74AE
MYSAPSSPPPGLRQQMRGMFDVRRGPPGRWRFALRAAFCMGVPILAGWLSGDVAAGMLAATGGFTALYGNDRPYLNRARELALIALAFAAAVGIGMAAAPLGWVVVVPVVAVMAMVATWMGNAFQIGPPGAYMFLLACAAASGLRAPAGGPLSAALLVLGSGAFAWCVHMLGALSDPRGPEKSAVLRAGDAVAAFVAAVGTPGQDRARHAAARTLHATWNTLVAYQPARTAPGRLTALRAINRRMHLLFADAMAAAARSEPPPAAITEEVRGLQAHVRAASSTDALPPGVVPGVVPLGHPGATSILREALAPGSMSRLVVLRVGLAALVSGWIGAQFGLERSYWAVAAAVLMLHQGFDWSRTLVRSVERLLGTWVGLLLGGAIILLYPQGLWLVATVMALQFMVEMLVVRNYALAVVFITGAALLLASGGQLIESPGSFVLARGVDTAIGCTVALLVFRLLPARPAAVLPAQLARTVRGVDAVVAQLARGTVVTPVGRAARRDLQRKSFALQDAYEAAIAAAPEQRREAERQWPTVAAAQQLAYRTLSACWTLEQLDSGAAATRARELFGDDGAAQVRAALRMLADTAAARATSGPLGLLPPLLERELHNLQECLARQPLSMRD